MTKKYVIFTAIFGPGYKLKDPLYPSPNCDYICFTDQSNFKSSIFKIKKVRPSSKDLKESSREIKILSHKFLPHKASLYIDASVLVTTKDIYKFIEEHITESDFWVFQKLNRKSVLKEIKWCIKNGKEQANILKIQYDFYLKKGFIDNQKMINGAVILRNLKNKTVNEFMEKWWEQIQKFGKRDEISFPYVAWKNHFQYKTFEKGTVYNNPYFIYSK